MKDIFRLLISNFQNTEIPEVIQRDVQIDLYSKQIVSILGSRRSGKTYLLYQIIRELLGTGVAKNQIVFINFEDERLASLNIQNFDEIIQAYVELYPEQDLSKVHFFFDEIQNFHNWEVFVRRIHETISKTVYVTGSNSKFLTTEIATSLRGRTISYEVFPTTFKEFLKFKNIEPDKFSTKGKAVLNNSFLEYLEFGGFPDIINTKSKVTKIQILQSYYDTMIFNDLLERYEIKNLKAIQFFTKQLIASHTKEFSINKIYNTFKSINLSVSREVLYDYLDYCQNMYLGKVLSKYNLSEKVRDLSDKKFYTIDNGLYNSLVFKQSEDFGKLLEQVVFFHLLQEKFTVFYYKDRQSECDFLAFDRADLQDIVQVCVNLRTEEIRNREINGLVKACKYFGKNNGKIITLDTTETFKVDNIEIQVLSITDLLI